MFFLCLYFQKALTLQRQVYNLWLVNILSSFLLQSQVNFVHVSCAWLAMDNRGAFTVIINCLLVHIMFALDIPSYIVNTQTIDSIMFALNGGFGVSLLLFPLLGFLADVYVTRYQMIQKSFLFLAVFLILALTIAFMSVIFLPQDCGRQCHLL